MAIEYRVLGKTRLRVSTLGFGGSEVGYQAVAQKTVDKILNTALDAGINVIDTAECYADGEALIGKAISKRRAEFVLMTKCGHAPLGSASERAAQGTRRSFLRIGISLSYTRLTPSPTASSSSRTSETNRSRLQSSIEAA